MRSITRLPLEGEDFDFVVIKDRRSPVGAVRRKGPRISVDFESRSGLGSHVVAAIMFRRQLQIDTGGFAVGRLVFNPQVRQADLASYDFETVFSSDLALFPAVFLKRKFSRFSKRRIGSLLQFIVQNDPLDAPPLLLNLG